VRRPAVIFLALGHLWALPLTLINVLLAVLVYRARSWRWSDGCLECIGGRRDDGRTRIWGRPGAQTFSGLIVYASAEYRERAELRVHERIHVVHAFLLGVLFAATYGLHFLGILAFPPSEPAGAPRWRRAYLRVWSERIAYRVEGAFRAGHRAGAWGSLP
jgi:hypothetical protein